MWILLIWKLSTSRSDAPTGSACILLAVGMDYGCDWASHLASKCKLSSQHFFREILKPNSSKSLTESILLHFKSILFHTISFPLGTQRTHTMSALPKAYKPVLTEEAPTSPDGHSVTWPRRFGQGCLCLV